MRLFLLLLVLAFLPAMAADQLETAPAYRTAGSSSYMEMSDPNSVDGPKWCATMNGVPIMNPLDTSRFTGRCYTGGSPARWACPSGFFWSPQPPIEWLLVTSMYQPATCVKGIPTECPPGEIAQGDKCVSKCAALKDGAFDLKGTILKGSPSLTLCRNSGDAKCSYDVTGGRFDAIIAGGTGDYVYTAGKGTWTGNACSTPNTEPADPTQPPPQTTSPKGPQDCPAGTTFAYVEGKGTCQNGKTPDNNTSDYCKSPDHQYEKTCGEGGEEFCKANPQTYACIPGSERYCTLKPAAAACQPGNSDFCKANTDHASCQPGTKEYCATHPGDQACAVKQAEECANNPAIQNSDACKKAEQCAKYPNDPACKTSSGSTGGAQSDYCKQFPNDSKCVAGTFAGNCTSGFVCKGDAVQCAIAKELHRQGCAEAPTQDDYEMPGKWPEIVGKDGVEGSAIAGREEGVDLGQITMPDVSGVGSTCAVQDTSFAIDAIEGFSGGTVTIPTSLICTHGGAIRALLLFLSSLSCLWLIFTFGVKD